MASIGLRINQPYGGGVDTGVADVFAKALFGDPEAAAKIALAKAQIATQGAAAANYGATTRFTDSKTAQNEAELAAREAGATSLGPLLAASVPEPVARETPRPMPDFQGPMPTVVQPADRARYDAARAAAPGIARAAIVGGGGNAEQIMRGALGGAGGFGLLGPTDPSRVRADATLYTGTAPSNNSTLMPGDTAGAENEIAINEAKPTSEKVIKDKAGNSYTLERGPDGEMTAVPVPGMPVIQPGETGPFEGESAEMAYNRIITGYNTKKTAGEQTTPEEDRAYALAYNARFGDKTETRNDANGQPMLVTVTTPPPQGIVVPGQSSTVSGAPAPAAVPAAPNAGAAVAPAAQVAAAAAPQFPLPESPPSLSPLLGPGRPVAVGAAPARPPASQPIVPAAAPPPVSLPAPVVAPSPAPGTPGGARASSIVTLGPQRRIPASEWQGKNSAFLRDAYKAEQDLKNYTPTNIPSSIKLAIGDPTLEGVSGRFINAIADQPTRQYYATMLGFVNGILRRDSGAAIRREEFPMVQARFIPAPGDDETTLRMKAENREIAMQGLKDGALGEVPVDADGKPSFQASLDQIDAIIAARKPAGSPSGSPGSPAPAAPTAAAPAEGGGEKPRPRMRFNPKTGKLEPTNG